MPRNRKQNTIWICCIKCVHIFASRSCYNVRSSVLVSLFIFCVQTCIFLCHIHVQIVSQIKNVQSTIFAASKLKGSKDLLIIFRIEIVVPFRGSATISNYDYWCPEILCTKVSNPKKNNSHKRLNKLFACLYFAL